MKADPDTMEFWEHLEALRWVLIKSGLALFGGTAVCFWFVRPLLALLLRPAQRLGTPVTLIFTAPTDAFMTQFKVALLGGAVLAAPLVLHFLAGFVAPALRPEERRIARGAVCGGALLFAAGVVAGYAALYVMLPALMVFSLESVRQMWNVKDYLDFCVRFMLGTGLACELPMVLTVLARLGLVRAAALTRLRPYAVIAVFVVAAVVTPSPDVFTQVVVGLPMVGLYEVSIVLVRWQQRRRERLAAASME